MLSCTNHWHTNQRQRREVTWLTRSQWNEFIELVCAPTWSFTPKSACLPASKTTTTTTGVRLVCGASLASVQKGPGAPTGWSEHACCERTLTRHRRRPWTNCACCLSRWQRFICWIELYKTQRPAVFRQQSSLCGALGDGPPSVIQPLEQLRLPVFGNTNLRILTELWRGALHSFCTEPQISSQHFKLFFRALSCCFFFLSLMHKGFLLCHQKECTPPTFLLSSPSCSWGAQVHLFSIFLGRICCWNTFHSPSEGVWMSVPTRWGLFFLKDSCGVRNDPLRTNSPLF